MLQSKKSAVIQKGINYSYDAASFFKAHKVANFYEIDDPQEILKRVVPFEYDGRRFITFDTETHPYYACSQDVPRHIVRRWVGTGKKAKPQDYPFCMSICDGVNAYSIFDTIENGFSKFRQLAPLFEDASIEKIAHNWKFDAHMFANAGMRMIGRVHDTVVLAKLAYENRNSFELRELAARLPGGIVKFEYMLDSYKTTYNITDYRDIPKELLSEYANADVWNCFLEFISDYKRIEQEELVDLYNKECELMIVSYAMERRGMKVDVNYEEPLKHDLQLLADTAEKAIYEEAGRIFNINSGKQLYDVLLSLGVNKTWIPSTDKGNPQLDKDALNMLADKYNVNIVVAILEFRKYEKLLSTYAVGIYAQRDSENIVHCNINQTEATTGRMSITKPALQTLPKKDKRIRRAFIPCEDFSLWFMDLDQIEYRLFAHYAKATNLLQAIINGYDVHAATAAMLFHFDLEEFIAKMKEEEAALSAGLTVDTPATDKRSRGKTINFALIYGVGIESLSIMLKCTVTEATELKARYFAQLPEARTFIQTVYQVIKQRGFVKNFYGRRRRLDPDDCYKAPNSLIQGCAADYIKNKTVDIYKYISFHNLMTHLNLSVHDELVISSHKDETEHMPVLRWLLSDFVSFRCPITAGVEHGNPSWGQKISGTHVGFAEPTDNSFKDYDVYNGNIFDIGR